jgi:hypothetical protein
MIKAGRVREAKMVGVIGAILTLSSRLIIILHRDCEGEARGP